MSQSSGGFIVRERNNVRKRNKDLGAVDRWLARAAAYLRGYRRTVHDHILRGVSYGVGSGAVSLLVIWYETRR
jgi:hypothetical protein